MRRLTSISMLVAAWLAVPVFAAAQARAEAGTVEISAGGLYMNRLSLGSSDGKLTTGTGDAFPLFTTTTSLSAMTGGELQAGYRVSDHLEVFGAGGFGKRQLRIEAANDKENAPSLTASERLQEFVFTGGVRWLFSEGGRFSPFVTVEAGQARRLHEDKTLVETSLVYAAGAGVNMLFSDSGSFGVRLTGRGIVRPDEFLLDTKRVSPAVSIAVFMRMW